MIAALLACGARTAVDAPWIATDAAAPGDGGAALDAMAGRDASDAAREGDADGSACGDAGPSEHAYALDDLGAIWRYDPVAGVASRLGAPSCGNGDVQWTMTASRDRAYIVYTDWTLYRVDLATLACSPTPFDPGPLGLQPEFGVAVTGSGASERIFVYGLTGGSPNPILAVMDTSTFAPKKVADIHPAPPQSSFPVNLTADESGRLYAFSPGGLVQVIDPTSGAVLQSVNTGVSTMSTWATVAYATDLYLWVDSRVVGYDVASQAPRSDHDAGVRAVGAGSFLTCP